MADTINLRAINETPVVEAISDGDKALLVDANGMAKQSPANKLGGSGGGGGIIYGVLTMSDGTTDNAVMLYADEANSQMITYEEAKEMFKSGAIMYTVSEGGVVFITPTMVMPIEGIKALQLTVLVFGQAIDVAGICSDTVMG